jgi:hypothetical protein
MATKKTKAAFNHQVHYDKQLAKVRPKAPFLLRITEWKDKPIPVLVVKERIFRDEVAAAEGASQRKMVRNLLEDRGNTSGEALRQCLPVLRKIVEPVTDKSGVPLELQRYLTTEGLRLRGNLPLDEESGAKLALIFRLQDRIQNLDRVELIAWRVAQFTREEAVYWLSRITNYGADANRWGISGLRTMLCGHGKDDGVGKMLARFRLSA